jgi:RNA polymerase sigma-70 factor (ECF subfamily)
MSAEVRHLVLDSQNGDIDAFSKLVEIHWVRLVSFARSVAGERDAEDVVQDSLLRAWEKIRSLRDPDAFLTWILRIISRRCFSRFRRLRLMMPLEMVADLADPREADRIAAVDVERMLALLPRRQRAVMHLTVVEGMSDSEIALALVITPASVRSHRRRAREALDRMLKSRSQA